eukprot:CAMPEP_0182416314 /NCGR_PEP_ID=MMETSP1167-20130531/581_1 /TAXON_ID=2988 /ORGANISM="Mallomonas Sp, Strain CCMP3275" /LENGTH=348 /DNA_ID=CAMNT_0024588967 /DNA_START=538 /DNA_END=1584 /DNA_ORIENTATION=-
MGRGLKLADFGSCRGIYSKQPYTEYISTRWYRAPECLLTDGYYGPEMDMWGAGCVFFEITSLYPLFPGSNEVDQISRIHKVLSTPTPEIIAKFKSKGASHISFDFPPQKGIGIPQLVPHAAPEAIDLMVKMIKYDASERISARETLRHPYFREIREQEQRRGSQSEIKMADGETKSIKPTKSENLASNTSLSSLPAQNSDQTGSNKNLPDIGSKPNADTSMTSKGSTGSLLQAGTGALPPITQQPNAGPITGKTSNNSNYGSQSKIGGNAGAGQQQQSQQAGQSQAAAARKRKKTKGTIGVQQDKALTGGYSSGAPSYVSGRNGGLGGGTGIDQKVIQGVQGRKSSRL